MEGFGKTPKALKTQALLVLGFEVCRVYGVWEGAGFWGIKVSAHGMAMAALHGLSVLVPN